MKFYQFIKTRFLSHLHFNWRAWLPSRGNVVFTLAVVTALFWAQSVNALPWSGPTNVTTQPSTISYQGTLATAGGAPINGNIGLIFRLYTVQQSGTPLWEETHNGVNVVPVVNGLFNTTLGSITPIPSSIWNNSTVYLGVQIEGDIELAPREQIGSVPFASSAANVPNIPNIPKMLDSITCATCGDVTESISAGGWIPVKGATASDLIQVTVTTTGRPLLVILNARYSSTTNFKWCAISVIQNGQTINTVEGDGSEDLANDFSCSSSILISNLPAGTYTFRAVAWQRYAGSVIWHNFRQIAVIEY